MYSDFLPESYDASMGWEECLGYSVIQQQGNCSACCPMAIASALSARECMQNGRNVLFSAQQLWDCAGDFSMDKCEEGTVFSHMVKVMAESSARSKILIPNECSRFSSHATSQAEEHVTCNAVYDECASNRTGLISTALWSSVYANELKLGLAGGGKNMNGINAAKALMAEIWVNGPVVAVLSLFYRDFLVFEKLGRGHDVFVPGTVNSSDFLSFLESNDRNARHCVMVYGWGQDKKTGINYWLIQNSYGAEWGDGGKGRVVRGYNWLENEWRGLSTNQMQGGGGANGVPCSGSSGNTKDDYCLSASAFNKSISDHKIQALMNSESAMLVLNYLLAMELHNSTLFPAIPVNPPTFVKLKELSRVSNGEIWAITWACSIGILLLALALAYLWKSNSFAMRAQLLQQQQQQQQQQSLPYLYF